MSASRKDCYGALPVMERGRGIHVGVSPKGEEICYACGPCLFVRNVQDPKKCWTYDDHQHPPTVGKWAPSGFYIASGDARGNVKIWDTTQETHATKFELPVVQGRVRDLAWTEDSKRIAAVGESQGGQFGRVFMWDSGSSVGEITGQSENILAVSIKQTRPYRMVTGGEDNAAVFFQGPPFKFVKSLEEHSRFVTDVAFSPNGEHFVIVSQDKKGTVYDGKEGTKVAELGGHSGGIYAVSWAPDSSKLVTCSADKTLVIHSAASGFKPETTLSGVDSGGQELDDQQLAVAWAGNTIVSVSLGGFINLWNPAEKTDGPVRVLRGHNKNITAMVADGQGAAYTAGFDGLVLKWDLATGDATPFEGVGHMNQVNAMRLVGGKLLTGSLDDSARVVDVAGLNWASAHSVACSAPVLDVAGHESGLLVAVTAKSVYVTDLSGAIQSQFAPSYEPLSVAVSPCGGFVVIGGNDHKIHVYKRGETTELQALVKHHGPVGQLAFSPDGKYLASADIDKRLIVLWTVADWTAICGKWQFHNGRINSLAWAPDSKHLASGSLDQDIYVWDTEKIMKKIHIKGAHRSGVNAVSWADGNTLLSVGNDCALRSWNISFF